MFKTVPHESDETGDEVGDGNKDDENTVRLVSATGGRIAEVLNSRDFNAISVDPQIPVYEYTRMWFGKITQQGMMKYMQN